MVRPLFGAAFALVVGVTPAIAQNFEGPYTSSEGDLYLSNTYQDYPKFEGVYGNDGGRLYLGLRNRTQKQLAGYWTENYSNYRCSTPYRGTYYWGRVYFRYGIVGTPNGMLLGEWTYCNFHSGGDNSRTWIAVPRR